MFISLINNITKHALDNKCEQFQAFQEVVVSIISVTRRGGLAITQFPFYIYQIRI